MDTTRASACTYALMKRPLNEALPVFAAAGFRKIDILGRMPHFSLDAAECDWGAVKTAAAAHGIAVANLGTYVGGGFASDDPAKQKAELAALFRAVDAAAFFGARSIRVLRGRDCDKAALLDRFVPWLREGCGYAAQKRVYLGIENHGGEISGSPERCRELFDKVGSPWLGLLYDPCNYFTYGEDYKRGLECLKDRVVHVHFKDSRRTDTGTALCMLGEGQIDFGWVAAKLKAIGYTGDLALEYELETPPAEVGLPQWFTAYAAMK